MHRSHASAGFQSTATPLCCCAQTTPFCNSTSSSSLCDDVEEVVLAVKKGRTGLPIGGVCGAGKTRSAAVLLADLLVFGPSLKLISSG